ncbi:dolichyl-phosphate-mannose-protein mannosyltransferase [Terrimicrobium sacchariphilum]|uniref:Dolichyl-phosphate-mannose-protein mannosyltransferase n=1 Tax=Terrimicrobium sacchariphilum TaxID=690879 RepID=A0A146GG06_TERSA|nr:glycosyltransferase family 39 protein [Terrimicrobium sacchariphilum]GAT35388.1 dolichyl-phosphate-mannose-protein mannosyltransferase [Terrimicrobium sacchariphilum]
MITSFFTIDQPSPRASLSWRHWAIAVAFFALALGIFTRHDHFPSFYHPDEPSKARQLIQGEFNFNHPLLLLQTARLVAYFTQAGDSQQAVTEAGRFSSALFSAAAIACLVLTAAHLRGAWTAAAAGLLVVTNSQLYELSHYMKEDPALVFGIAAFFLALVRCWIAPSPARFLLLGGAAALAISGKYIGALVLPVALIPIFLHRSRWISWLCCMLTGLALVLLAINYPMISEFVKFTSNVEREMDYAAHGHKGLTRSVPHGVYTRVFADATNPFIWALLIIYYAGMFGVGYRWRNLHASEWALALFPVAYMLILSFSPKTHHRYFLPDTLLFCTIAALAAFHPARDRFSRVSLVARHVLLGCAIIWSGTMLARVDAAFQNDSRQALIEFVKKNVPPDAIIVQDKRVNLPSRDEKRHADSPYFVDQKILGKLFAADVGTIDELRAQDIRYIAVANDDYNRFFLKTHKPKAEDRTEYERRKAFYQQLFAEGTLLWQCPSGPQQYLQPAIKFYYLPPKPEATPPLPPGP